MQSHRGFATEEVSELKKLLQNEIQIRKAAEEEISNLKDQIIELSKQEVCFE